MNHKIIYLKHFVGGIGAFEECSKGIERMAQATEIAKTRNWDVEFGLKLSYVHSSLGNELGNAILNLPAKLPKGANLILNPDAKGGGEGTRMILFNIKYAGDITLNTIYLACLDTVPIHREDSLEQIVEFGNKLEKENALLAVGSRSGPVVLAVNPANSHLRQIHEHYHSLAAGKGKLTVAGKKPNPSVNNAYHEIGESTADLYAINCANTFYLELNKSILAASRLANLNGNALDYYMIIKAAHLAKLSTGYIPHKGMKNRFYYENPPGVHVERKKCMDMIASQTRELGKTDIKSYLSDALKSEENAALLSRFYQEDEVEIVRNAMRRAVG